MHLSSKTFIPDREEISGSQALNRGRGSILIDLTNARSSAELNPNCSVHRYIVMLNARNDFINTIASPSYPTFDSRQSATILNGISHRSLFPYGHRQIGSSVNVNPLNALPFFQEYPSPPGYSQLTYSAPVNTVCTLPYYAPLMPRYHPLTNNALENPAILEHQYQMPHNTNDENITASQSNYCRLSLVTSGGNSQLLSPNITGNISSPTINYYSITPSCSFFRILPIQSTLSFNDPISSNSGTVLMNLPVCGALIIQPPQVEQSFQRLRQNVPAVEIFEEGEIDGVVPVKSEASAVPKNRLDGTIISPSEALEAPMMDVEEGDREKMFLVGAKCFQ